MLSGLLGFLDCLLIAAVVCAAVSVASSVGCYISAMKRVKENMLQQPVVVDEIRAEVRQRVNARQSFTAYDITKYLRKWDFRGRHDKWKQIVHQMFDDGEMVGYTRELRDMGGAVPAWYYFHQSDYAAQQYTTNVAQTYTNPTSTITNIADQPAKSISLGLTSGYVQVADEAPKQDTSPRIPVAVVSEPKEEEITARPDRRGTICIPARAIRQIGLEPGDGAIVIPNCRDRLIHVMHPRDLVAGPQVDYRVYTVDKDYNIRITSVVVDEAWAWASNYRVRVETSGCKYGELKIVPNL